MLNMHFKNYKRKQQQLQNKQTNKNHEEMYFKIALMIKQRVNVQTKQEIEA